MGFDDVVSMAKWPFSRCSANKGSALISGLRKDRLGTMPVLAWLLLLELVPYCVVSVDDVSGPESIPPLDPMNRTAAEGSSVASRTASLIYVASVLGSVGATESYRRLNQ